jgi:hypothetical protein
MSKSREIGIPIFVLIFVTSVSHEFAAAQSADDDLPRVIALIDSQIESHWIAQNVSPTEPVDDAEFLRRVSLDLVGRIPTVMEVREFLDDTSPDKRRQLVDRLLDDPRYAVHFTNYWRKVLIPEVETDFNVAYLAPGFDAWLRTKLLENASYKTMVGEILSVDVSGGNMYRYTDTNPIAFYAAKEIKPENLAAATSRMFLGVRIECAQCHDHPFDQWKRRDFWGYSAFFAGLEQSRPGPGSFFAGLREFFGQRKVQIPDTEEYVEPTYLDGTPMPRGTALKPRQALTEWIISDSNPYFARTAVNRLWAHFFGTGFVDPIDDFSERNPPSHPELLDALAKEFVSHQYDLKFLVRAITLSRAYQLTSRQTDSRQADPKLFAKMAVRGLSPEQLYDNLAQATGRFEPFAIQYAYVFGQVTPRGRITELFSDIGTSSTDRPTTILQSLALMNGDLVNEATQVDRGQLLGSIADFPGFKADDRIEALYLSTFSRLPTDAEREALTKHLAEQGTEAKGRQALADVFWAMLNSSEFLYNH